MSHFLPSQLHLPTRISVTETRPKLDRNATETSTSGFPYFRTLNNVSWSGSRAAPAGSQHSYTKKDHQMKKVLAMLFLALGVSASFAQTTSNVVFWKTIVGNIT